MKKFSSHRHQPMLHESLYNIQSFCYTDSEAKPPMNHNLMHTYTKDEIIQQLDNFHIPKGVPVLMHSSLRAIGKVAGGPEGLLDILIGYFTRDGGLFCVPTHTWQNLEKPITLDMNSDETCLGAFPGIAIRDPRGFRSENPSHSMVVFGDRDKALAFVKDELWVPTPTAPSSCYGKLLDMSGYVLLAGVAHNRNTFLHTVDELLNISNRMDNKPIPVAVRRKDGQIVGSRMCLFYTDYTDDISRRFVKYETPFRYHRCITDGFLGNAPAQLCDTRKMKETVELIYRNSDGMDPLADEEAIPPRWYCIND